MKRAYLLYLAILAISFSLILSYRPTTIQAGSTGLNTQLLSDHSLTEADTYINIYGYDIDTSNGIAHIFWQETGNGSEGIDLFYRQLPGGSTIRLSDPTLSEGDVSLVAYDTAVAPNGTFHIIWLEDTNSSEGGDLFYWSAASGTMRLSDHAETEGYVQPAFRTISLSLDPDGNPHTFWHEETGTTEGEDLFYWSESTGTILLTDRNETEGNDVDLGPNKLEISENGTTHITWGEYGNDGVTKTYFYWNSTLATPIILPNIQSSIIAGNIAHIHWGGQSEGPLYYWNSATQSSQAIPSSSDPGGYVISRMVVDSSNTVHILWSEGATNVCLSHWNSASNQTNDLVTGDVCYPPWAVYVDNVDNLHTIVVDDPMGTLRYRYWNSTLTSPVEIPIGDGIGNGKLTGIEGSSEVHVTWTESVGPNEDYYHWDNINQTASNLSQIAGSDTHISSYGRQIDQSSDGKLHLLWSEQINGIGTSQNLYWNSDTNTTQNLFSTFSIDTLNLVNSSTESMRMDFLANGAPYFMWHGVPTSGPEGLYLWDSSQDSVHLAGESYPCSEIGRAFKNDSDNFGNVYLAWQDDTTWNYHFWSQDTGEVTLSQTTAAETKCHPPVLSVADNGSVFMIWVEESDVAGEGLDIYAGWIEASTNKTYLPLVVNP